MSLPAAANTYVIRPEDDVSRIIESAASGSTFVFDGGEYRELSLKAKDGDVFVGSNGATLNGSRIIHDFVEDEEGFSAKVPDLPQPAPFTGSCMAGWICDDEVDLFVDGARQRLVKGRPSPGEYSIDHTKNIVRVSNNPRDHLVELAIKRFAIFGSANDVTVQGLIIKQYANPAQSGAVGGNGTGARWKIYRCDIRDNHGAGVHVGDAGVIIGSHIHRNGQLGASASAEGFIHDVVVKGNEVDHNNELRFDPAWEAGGVKVVRAIEVTYSDNYVHDNLGPGLWTDIDSRNVTYEGNIAVDNFRSGIQHEISDGANIRHNVVQGNGFGTPVWGWGAQIILMNSREVNVHDNDVTVHGRGTTGISLIHQERGNGPWGPRVMSDAAIHDNFVTYRTESGFAAIALLTDVRHLELQSDRMTLDRNRYAVPDLEGAYWIWSSRTPLAWSGLRANGQEQNGQLSLLRE